MHHTGYMYSLRILFFSLPLYFSHFFSPIGIVIGETYSFERYKVYLFLFLIVVGYIEVWIRFPQRIWSILCRYAPIFFIILTLPILSAVYFAIPLDTDWFMGSYEKHHGYIFYFGIISLIFLLISSSREQIRSYLRWSIYAAGLVAMIAIGERIGGILDMYGRSEMLSAYSGRSVSTLGNPNYVAGYLLFFLPLLTLFRLVGRWIILAVLSIAIVMTGSYIGMILLGMYCIYALCRNLAISAIRSLVWLSILSLVLLYFASLYIDPQKILSLTSRFVLMRESISMMMSSPMSFLVGFGPDSIITHFAQKRSILVNSYFPVSMHIDSSHNIIIDILFQYGCILLFVIVWLLYRYWHKQPEQLQIALIIGSLFLILNVFVIVHIMILALLVVLISKSEKV